MMYTLSEQQALIQDSFGRFFRSECSSDRFELDRPLNSREVWKSFLDLGGLGADGEWLTVVERALVMEQAGWWLARLPAIDSWLVGDSLRCSAPSECRDVLVQVAEGSLIASFVPSPIAPGRRQLVPYGKMADIVIGFTGDKLAFFERRQVEDAGGKLGQDLMAYWQFDAPSLLISTGPSARAAFEGYVRQWKTLVAAQLVGLAGRAVKTGADYASTRHAFGVPIGAFQGVSHALADAAVQAEGARLLVLEAAWAIDDGRDEAELLAPMAFIAAREAASVATRTSVHVHGGYGITTEQEIQRYFRFAKALAAPGGDPAFERATIGALLVDRGQEEALPPFGFYSSSAVKDDEDLDFSFGEAERQFRDELRAFFNEHQLVMQSGRNDFRPDTDEHSPDFHRLLGSAGFIGMSWPREYGGQEQNALRMSIFADELRRAGYWSNALGTSRLVAETLIVAGTEEQRRRFLPAIAAGEVTVALGYTEPGSGSDAAAASTRAVRDGDEWVINGQKMFTTSAHFADYVFLLARTNPSAPKTRGLTMFLVPLRSEGVEVRPIHTIGDERTNVTFYSDVRVPDELRVGRVDEGWKVMGAALKNEHNGGFGWLAARLLAAGVQWVGSALNRGDDPMVLSRLADAAIAAEVGKLLNLRVAWMRAAGEPEPRALVSCHTSNVGYRRFSLIRASCAVNCQLTFAWS
ncbi:MAG: acyl-CoA dehydrogenase family protein [Pseudomonadales bacterium]